MFELTQGDCLEVLKTLADNSVDAVVTDPPYELGFMGKGWDATGIANNPALWSEVLRVLKPGGHLASFGGTRTYHRMACAIEDAGFEVRDQLAWVYGQGFPKSLDVSKAIDKAAGAEREVIGKKAQDGGFQRGVINDDGWAGGLQDVTAPATAAARQWEGWGTALKPAWEPICLARKPLSEKTVAANVLRWGTGAINIDACRVGTREKPRTTDPKHGGHDHNCYGAPSGGGNLLPDARFPANLCHDGSDEVLDLFPETKSGSRKAAEYQPLGFYGNAIADRPEGMERSMPALEGDSGSAARFMYCAKASRGDRAGSKHPTVKPVKLMQWLCRLLAPPGGVILDPFAGSGTTGAAAILEGFSAILIEREDEYCADIRRRLDHGDLIGASQAAITHRPQVAEISH